MMILILLLTFVSMFILGVYELKKNLNDVKSFVEDTNQIPTHGVQKDHLNNRYNGNASPKNRIKLKKHKKISSSRVLHKHN